MRLVIDTSILISALLKDSVTREILLFSNIESLLPEYAFGELERHKNSISNRSGLSIDEIDIVLSLISENIAIISASELKPHMEKAFKIIGKIDPLDVPFVALALATNNNGIWTNDKHFEALKGITVWKTTDVLSYLAKNKKK